MSAFAVAAPRGENRAGTVVAGCIAALAAAFALVGAVLSPEDVATPTSAEFLAGMPLSFEPNRGQLPRGIDFYAAGRGHALAVSAHGVTFTKTAGRSSQTLFELELAGASANAVPAGERRLRGTVNYLVGADASKWRRAIPTFARTRFNGVYPGIDVVYYGQGRQLEYDFLVSPRADPGAIAFRLRGSGRPRIDAAGDLLVRTKAGTVRQRKPFAYQDANGARRPVDVAYEQRAGGAVGFSVGDYDPTKPLVIDPTVVFSTYLDYTTPDGGNAIATDSAGNVYLTGRGGPGMDVLVMKINAQGTAIEYTTYVGGTSFDSPDLGTGIAVDANGYISVGGNAWTSDFPLVNAFQTKKASIASNDSDGFVFRLKPDGKSLVYSTYLGGSDRDDPYSIAVDSAGSAYVTGWTESPIQWADGTSSPLAFPTTAGSYQPKLAGDNDGFLSKFDPSGKLVYSTYLGGVWEDLALDVAVDGQGSAYVTGVSDSSDYPTTSGAYKTTQPNTNGDAFVTKFKPDGSGLVYSTLLGGSHEEIAWGIAVDAGGNAYLTGYTYSLDYPATGAFQAASGGAPDAFVAKLNATGSALVYSSYLGGSDGDKGVGIALDTAGAAYVSGQTFSRNFPVVQPVQSSHAGGADVFVTKIDPAGASLSYSTFWGGGDPSGISADYGGSIAVDGSGNAFVGGTTYSANFPLVNPLKSSLTKANHAFLLKLTGGAGSTFFRIHGYVSDGLGNAVPDATVTLGGSKSATVQTNEWGGYAFTGLAPGGSYTVKAAKAGFNFTPASYSFSGLAADQQANFSQAASTTPALSSFTPTSGVAGLTQVTLNGTNFTAATAVKFNGTAASFSVVSATQIKATVPAGVTTGTISVTTAGGTATSASKFAVRLSVTGFAPMCGPAGTPVSVSGVGFTGARAVKVGNADASYSVLSGTAIRATVPSNAATGSISVTNASDQTSPSSSSFSLTATAPVPAISSFTPASGRTGTLVTIDGTNLCAARSVRFAGKAATFTIASPTRIYASVPNGATSGKISISTPAGKVATSGTDFTVTLSVTGFAPTSGPAGTVVTINGVGFTPAASVKFNAAAAASVTYVSSTQLKATVPSTTATGLISVTTAAGTVSSAGRFTKT